MEEHIQCNETLRLWSIVAELPAALGEVLQFGLSIITHSVLFLSRSRGI